MKHASLLALASMAMMAHAQPGWVLDHQKISDTEGGFTGILDDAISSAPRRPRWAISTATAWATWPWGHNGTTTGAPPRGGVGAVPQHDGTVKSHQKISDTEGGFTGILDDFDRFGSLGGLAG